MPDIGFESIENNQWDAIEGVAGPALCANVLGHNDVFEAFCDSFNNAQLHHAWLLTGPRGIGKASLAFKLARYVLLQSKLMQSGQGLDPEVERELMFSKTARGGHPNILHLSKPWDDKRKKFYSQITVNEIRRTVSFFGTTAAEGDWRICIVDTADDMNRNAANALLKILEEPPKQVVFLVLANNSGKILPTIRSRCRHINMRALGSADLHSVLDNLDCETPETGSKEAELFSNLAMGSVRRALFLLSMDGMALFDRLQHIIVNTPAINWVEVHKLADELSRKTEEERYNLFLDLVRQNIGMQLHLGAQTNTAICDLAGLCEVWEKTENNAALANSYNLDRKQVILNLFSDYAQLK